MQSNYHEAVHEVYKKAAEAPAKNLCCVPQAPQFLPGLVVPDIMHEMNYGCGGTVNPKDMTRKQSVVYVGVGGGLELLQLAYFTRRTGGVIGVDPVGEMREVCRKNLEEAARVNDWFEPEFVDLRDGDALALPLDDGSVSFAAQNCLFNIFTTGGDLEKALSEVHRVLKVGGRLAMSDPVSPGPLPQGLKDDPVLRAECIGGCLPFDDYVKHVTDAGFGAAEIRSRRPYRHLDAATYGELGLTEDMMLETIELTAFRTQMPDDGPCVFTGRTATYKGKDESFDDGKGHVLPRNLPQPVCDKTAGALAALGRDDLTITGSTYHYGGGGCC